MTALERDEPIDIELPQSLKATRLGAIAHLRLARPEKRNALDDTTVLGLEAFFTRLPPDIRAVVLTRRRRALFRRPRPFRGRGAA